MTSLNPQKNSVAVIIAAYNAASFIGRAIESALRDPDITQIIVVNDASRDNTVEVARSFDDGSGRLIVLTQSPNAGPAAARNLALSHVSTEWATVLDADDFMLPGRMAGLLEFAATYDFIADDMWKVPEDNVGGPRTKLLPENYPFPREIKFYDFVMSNVTRRRSDRAELGFIKPLMRMSFLRQHHLLYQSHMRLGEDYELYARALGLGARLILVPARGYVSVVRPNSLSGNHSENDLRNLRECDDDLMRDLPLTPRDCAALRQHYLSVDCRYQWRMLIAAVKARNIGAAFKCFIRPWPVPLYLCERLLEQVYQRSIGRLIRP
jgi:succinoglycan biosynthesis protein ExoU